MIFRKNNHRRVETNYDSSTEQSYSDRFAQLSPKEEELQEMYFKALESGNELLQEALAKKLIDKGIF